MRRLFLACAATLMASLAYGHIRIFPVESTAGAREKYTMRVPNEKQVKCIRIDGEFPPDLQVNNFEFKPGWSLEFKKDSTGKIIGATWTGVMMPYEFVEFGMAALNPKEASSLVWKFVQHFEDGSKLEFNGPADSERPAPVVTLKKTK